MSSLATAETEFLQGELVGRPAPEFALTDQSGRDVRLSTLRGRWVMLYFYPREDTPSCACDATEYTDLLMRFHDMDAELFGVDDLSPKSHQVFSRKYHLTMPLLSDPEHEAMARYGAWVRSPPENQSSGRVIRSTFLIDPQGIVRCQWRNVAAAGHVDRVRQRLSELQASG
jgi:peroxiredoxin Q/BCP